MPQPLTHIALVTPGFGANEAETNCVPAIQDFLIGLRETKPNFSLTVFSLRYPHTEVRYSWHGVDVFPANGRQLGIPAILPSWTRLVRNFRRVNRRQQIRLVHSFWLGECAMIGEFLSRLFRIPHVITLMGQEIGRHNRYAWLLRSQRATLVAVSEFQRRQLLNNWERDVDHVIPWGVPQPKVDVGRVRNIDVIGVGSLSDVKDFDMFLDVVSRVRASVPSLTCRIVGEGPNRSALETRAGILGLDVVKFDGWISRERVLELMSRSRVLLHTSRFESFGLVLAEALACGVRIVSRPVGIAEAGPAWFVDDDPAAMAAAVARFLRDPRAPEPVVHSVERAVTAYDDLYRRLCDQVL